MDDTDIGYVFERGGATYSVIAIGVGIGIAQCDFESGAGGRAFVIEAPLASADTAALCGGFFLLRHRHGRDNMMKTQGVDSMIKMKNECVRWLGVGVGGGYRSIYG